MDKYTVVIEFFQGAVAEEPCKTKKEVAVWVSMLDKSVKSMKILDASKKQIQKLR